VRFSRPVWIFVVACAAAACATVSLRGPKPLHEQLKFSHMLHVAQGDCDSCHGEIAKSDGPTKGKFIKKGHEACTDCHEDETKDKKKCTMCHKGSNMKISLTRRDRLVIFSHKKHLALPKAQHKFMKGGCKHCHKKAYSATKAGTNLNGPMAVCTDACHKKDLKDQDCAKCHRKLTRQSLVAVAQLGHQGNFIKRHGQLARNTQRCAQCHDQTYCGECHAKTAAMPLSIRYPENVNSQYIHRNNFVARHAVEARSNPTTCRKCHGARHCQTCHQMAGLVGPAAGTKLAKAGKLRKVHGPSWMVPGTTGFHGRFARRDASKCASCHDQGAASNCVTCHKVGGLGGNPHPPSFKWRSKSKECRTNAMCLSCHIAGMGCK
jgi:hypothetical protein